MRRVKRSYRSTPWILESDALSKWHTDIKRHYALAPDERHRRRAPFPAEILQEPQIVDGLIRLFQGKCAYCELPFHVERDIHVGHYRPPSNALQTLDRDDSPDHYGWLSLEWDNLLPLCGKCFYAKSNVFPVRGARAEPLMPWDKVRRMERPLLLDPCTDSPSMHLGFALHGEAMARSARGEATIEIMKLNRRDLVHQRAAALEVLVDALTQRANEVGFRASLNALLGPHMPLAGVGTTFVIQLCRRIEQERGIRGVMTGYNPWRRVWNLRQGMRASHWRRFVDEAGSGVEYHYRRGTSWPLSLAAAARSIYTPVEGVSIEGFKGIDRLVLSLRSAKPPAGLVPCMMLLGENASGKSSALQAAAFALLTDDERDRLKILRSEVESHHVERWDESADAPLRVDVSFTSGQELRIHWPVGAAYPQRSGAVRQREDSLVLGYGAHRIVSASGSERRPRTSVTSLFNPFKPLPHPESWLRSIEEHLFDAVARSLRIILSLGPDDDIFRDANRRVLVRQGKRITPLDQLSDGYKSLMAMSVDIMRNVLAKRSDLEFATGVVLIDEIENHLHPRWKMRVMSALRQSMPMVQFIVTTHDPLCLRGMFDGEVKVVFRGEEGAIGVIEDLPDISTLRVDQLLTSDFFGLDSATDPGRDHLIAELAELAAVPEARLDTAQAARRDEILSRSFSLPVIGSSVDRHIVAEAVTRHLRERERADPVSRRTAKEASVRQIMDVLRRSEDA